jgi:hypothetical protein
MPPPNGTPLRERAVVENDSGLAAVEVLRFDEDVAALVGRDVAGYPGWATAGWYLHTYDTLKVETCHRITLCGNRR